MKRHFDLEKVAAAIEADMGEALPDIRQALAEVQSGVGARVTTPEQILLRQARQKTGLSQAEFARRIETPVTTLRDWEQGRFKPPAQLRAEFDTLLAGRDAAGVVHHCGSGVSAVPNVIAMELAGYAPAALYGGSWSEWSRTPGLPVAKG